MIDGPHFSLSFARGHKSIFTTNILYSRVFETDPRQYRIIILYTRAHARLGHLVFGKKKKTYGKRNANVFFKFVH